MMKLPTSSWNTARSGRVLGDEAAIAAAGIATVRTAATTTQRQAIGPRNRAAGCGRRAGGRSVGTSSGIAAKRIRYAGQAGMSSRQNVFAWMSARVEKPFTSEERGEPAAEERGDGRSPDTKDGEQAGERRPLGEPRAPEELAQLIHLQAPVVEVELDVAVDVERDEPRAGRHSHLPEREHRKLAEAALLPEHEHEQARDDRGSEDDPLTPAARDQVRERGAGAHQEVRRLRRACRPQEQSRQRGLGDPARIERAHDEERCGEHDDHRREVGERRQPERLREEVLGPALLVAVDEQRDRRERRDDPEERRPVAEQPPPDPLDAIP